MIEHKGECTGRWALSGVIADGLIRCPQCGATHAATPENTTAAFEDNYLGARLRELSQEGGALLEAERKSGE